MLMSTRRWNQGDMSRTPFANKRERVSHRVTVDQPPERVYEDVCSATAPTWLPADASAVLDKEGGGDEALTVWSDAASGGELFGPGGEKVFWAATGADAERRSFQATLLCPELAVGTLDVAVDADDGRTVVVLELSCTAISQAGAEHFGARLRARMQSLLEGIGGSLASRPATPRTVSKRSTRRRVVRNQCVIEGDIDDCFVQACPVAELDWIDDWKFDLLYSDSGRNETGCVFLEAASNLSMQCDPRGTTCWYSTLYDRSQHLFEAVWLTGDRTMARWRVTMRELAPGRTAVTWYLEWLALSAEGCQLLAEPGFEARVERSLKFLAVSLKRFVETGTMFRLPVRAKLKVAAALIGAALGRHFRRVHGRKARAA